MHGVQAMSPPSASKVLSCSLVEEAEYRGTSHGRSQSLAANNRSPKTSQQLRTDQQDHSASCAVSSSSPTVCRHLFTVPMWQLRQQAEAAAGAGGPVALAFPDDVECIERISRFGSTAEAQAAAEFYPPACGEGRPSPSSCALASDRLPSTVPPDRTMRPSQRRSPSQPCYDSKAEQSSQEGSRPTEKQKPLPQQEIQEMHDAIRMCPTPQRTGARDRRRRQHKPLQEVGQHQRTHSQTRLQALRSSCRLEEEEADCDFFVGVFVRVRPPALRERGDLRCLWTDDGINIDLKEPDSAIEHHFTFESVIDSSSGTSDQARVHAAVGTHVIQSVAEGFHTCIFALGHTGTGKTHTLIGNAEEPGLLPWSLNQMLKQQAHTGAYYCRLSCLELYMDRLHDLLADEPSDRQSLDIRCHPQSGVSVHNLTEAVVENVQAAVRVISSACRRRSVRRTNMNAVSSRGHTIFQVTNHRGTRLCIVDLAGRENERTTQCRGQSLAELGHINKSLFHLTSVIQALANPSSGGLVPFRNSKLTLLLSEPLQSARSFLLATVSPAAGSFDETLSTLRLAQTVMQIATKSRCEVSPAKAGWSMPASPSQGDTAASPDRKSQEERPLIADAAIPFAPRLQTPPPNAKVDTEASNSGQKTAELQPARFRLEAWKLSPSSATCGSTAPGNVHASIEALDSESSFDDSGCLVDATADSSCLVGEVVQATRIHPLPPWHSQSQRPVF